MNKYTKQEITDYLIATPEFDADWIDKVSDIVSLYPTEIEKFGIRDIDAFQDIDARFLHIILSLLKLYTETELSDMQFSMINLVINNIINKTYPMNATQAQIIASMVDYICRMDQDKIPDNVTVEVVKNLISSNIPYTALNFIAKGVLEGYPGIMAYVNNKPDVVANIYAMYADGVYDDLSGILSEFTDNNIISDKLSADKLNLLRFLQVTGFDFTVNDTIVGVKITVWPDKEEEDKQ